MAGDLTHGGEWLLGCERVFLRWRPSLCCPTSHPHPSSPSIPFPKAFSGASLVGAIAVRLELISPPPPPGTTPIARMYVMTVGVTAPHRGAGLGTALLARALAGAAEDPAIGSAFLHVHVANTDAIAFYERLGFVRGETVRGYYRRLTPPDAALLERRLR